MVALRLLAELTMHLHEATAFILLNGVLFSVPADKSTGVAAAHEHDLLERLLIVLAVKEVFDVGECLIARQVLQLVGGLVLERLRLTIEPVLQINHACFIQRGEPLSQAIVNLAFILSAHMHEQDVITLGVVSIRAHILVVQPVSLLVRAAIIFL